MSACSPAFTNNAGGQEASRNPTGLACHKRVSENLISHRTFDLTRKAKTIKQLQRN